MIEEMREKLFGLIGEGSIEFFSGIVRKSFRGYLADYLLANGVLIPPCKIGDDIWWVNAEEKIVECDKNGVRGVCWNGKEWYIYDKSGDSEPIGTRWCCLTKEDAEKILEEIIKNGGAE